MKMEYIIQNEFLNVKIVALGGEILSVKDRNNREYIRQEENQGWDRHAPHLFPYIARLTKGAYWYKDKRYKMDIHGFLMNSVMQLYERTTSSISLILKSNKKTKECYPFEFELYLYYVLESNKLIITYEVRNRDICCMYFGIGGHPGFKVPFAEGDQFEDCYLEFGEECNSRRIGMSEDCYVLGVNNTFELRDRKYLDLTHTLFDDDAVILENVVREVKLKSKNCTDEIIIRYPDMQYLGIWHVPHCEADFLCIEPWTSLPSRKDIVEDIEKQENLIMLGKGKIYKNSWSIEVRVNDDVIVR